jgi:N-acetylglutamate synthase
MSALAGAPGVPEMVARIEAATAAGWPATQQCDIGGWPVYLGEGRVGRTNSCWPLTLPDLPLAALLDGVEALYRAQGLCPQVKLVEAAPALAVTLALEPMLRARGYRPVSHVDVMVRALTPLEQEPGHPVALSTRLSPGFASTISATGEDAADSAERNAILARVPSGSWFASCGPPDAPWAVGLGMVVGGTLGIGAMRTLPQYRRRGFARAIVLALLDRACSDALEIAWLQVERGNTAAVRLYRALGFETRHGYATWRLD